MGNSDYVSFLKEIARFIPDTICVDWHGGQMPVFTV